VTRFFYLLATPVYCLALLVLPLVVGYVILQPLSRRSDASRTPVRRFTMLDFMALVGQMQFVLVLLPILIRSEERLPASLIAVLMVLGVLAIWWAGVEAAARIHLRSTARRLLLHLVLLPGTVIMMPASALIASIVVGTIFDTPVTPPDGEALGYGALAIAAVGGGIFFLRSLAGWIANEPRSQEPMRDAARPSNP
jgi:hypothetical protein